MLRYITSQMNCLELFAGTGSIGKVLYECGHNVISLNLKGADINTNRNFIGIERDTDIYISAVKRLSD